MDRTAYWMLATTLLLCSSVDSQLNVVLIRTPRDVLVTAESPSIISVKWSAPLAISMIQSEFAGYRILYRIVGSSEQTSISVPPSEIRIVDRDKNGPRFSWRVEGLSPDTSYAVRVRALFVTNPTAVNSNTSFIKTPQYAEPGYLIFAQGPFISYARINEDVLEDLPQRFIQNNMQLLHTEKSNVKDIDYHYAKRKVYYALSDEIRCLTLREERGDDDGVELEVVGDPEVVVSGLSPVKSITVDWVNNRLYYAQKHMLDRSEGQMCMIELDPGNRPISVGELPGLKSLTVDPIHGYLYWIDDDRNVRFIDLSSTLKPTNLITSSSQFLSGDVTAFAIDLVESQFVYTNASQIIQSRIGGEVVQMTNFQAQLTSPLSQLVSFAGEVLTYSSGRFTSYENGMINSEVSNDFGRPQVSALTLIRNISQPLPVPPASPGSVKAVNITNTSAAITWSQPVYSSDTFSPTAFSSWTYILNYRSSNAIGSITVSLNTSETSVHLESLRPATLYQLTITARGPGGDESPASDFSFTTTNTQLRLPFPAQSVTVTSTVLSSPTPPSSVVINEAVIIAAVGGGILGAAAMLGIITVIIIIISIYLYKRQKRLQTILPPPQAPSSYTDNANVYSRAEYCTVEATPYEAPVVTLSRPTILQPSGPQALYEEPLRSFAEYEVAVSSGADSPHNMYSSVDEAKEEAHQYASLHPATIDREEHVYTPPLLRTSSPANSPQQEHTSLEQGKRATETKVAADQSNDTESSNSDDEPAAAHTYCTLEMNHKDTKIPPKEHTYFTLDKDTLNKCK